MNFKNKSGMIILLTLITFHLVYAQQFLPVTHEFGSHYHSVCQGRNCSATLYSFTKYYLENDQWAPIDEDIGTENCQAGYTYCVDRNLYQAHFKSATVRVISGENSITLTTLQLGTASFMTPQLSTGVVNANQYSQVAIFPNATITYTYLPELLKEEITFYEPLTLPLGEHLKIIYALELSQNGMLQDDTILINPTQFSPTNPYSTTDITITFNQQKQFILPQPYAQDANGAIIRGEYAIYSDDAIQYLEVRFPHAWFTQATYPVTIDPTILLNATNMTWNGYLHYNATHYFRFDNPFVLKVGHFFRNTSTFINDTFRSVLEFDTSPIPKNVLIQEMDLTSYSTQAGTVGNNNISIHPLEKNNTQYSTENQTCLGNCNHHADAGNGTLYTSKNTTAGYNTFNLDTSINEFTAALQTQSWFSFGLTSHDGESQHVHGNQDARIASKDYPTPNNRPILNITYIIVANETAGRYAIDRGINQSALGSINPRDTDQIIYVVGQTGNQYRATFDKFTDKGNQSWAFNYVTGLDSFANFLSLFHVLNVWENETLQEEDIIYQVSAYINATLS